MPSRKPTTNSPKPTTTSPIENRKSKIENPITPPTHSEFTTLNSQFPPPLPSHPHELLPIGHLTLLLGDPGVGKSLLATDFAARLTRNSLPAPHPHQPRPAFDNPPEQFNPKNFQPAKILYLSTEDNIHTLSDRLQSAGADDSLALLPSDRLTLHHTDEQKRVPPLIDSLNRGILPTPLIHYLLDMQPRNADLRLIILDPLPSFLGLKDSSNPALIRRLLEPLLQLASTFNFAILGLSHLTKSNRSLSHNINPLHRAIGSLAYTALARSVLLLQPDPAGKNPKRRILHQLKNNLADPHPPLAFSLSNNSLNPTRPSSHHTISLQWETTPLAESPPFADSHTRPVADSSPPPDPFLKSQLDDAINFLTTILADGPLPSSQLLKESRTIPISTRTLTRAKYHLHARSFRDPNSRQWCTALPTPSFQPPDPEYTI